ncbi:hypothetical protein Mapa_006180 [Marchantia paleacea]|nr:hypothetical protein Mapa_006180 [Marchantia paleacea]
MTRYPHTDLAEYRQSSTPIMTGAFTGWMAFTNPQTGCTNVLLLSTETKYEALIYLPNYLQFQDKNTAEHENDNGLCQSEADVEVELLPNSYGFYTNHKRFIWRKETLTTGWN